ncbi:MAG: threonylcarbamoyl-AMP synthase [Deltaproteobacteria bacterium]|nr:threonylcarbamoyl-AMP synthase [Deltaproteobacteria bacterium]
MHDSQDHCALEAALAALRRAEPIVYPTETLYGLGVDATSAAAVSKLLALKVRAEGKPIAVLVSDRSMLDQLAARVTPLAERLIARFWPGPLTLVVTARHSVSPLLTGVTGTIGVRISSHPTATALVRGLGRPLTTPSANPAGATPPATIAQARGYFGDRVAVYLDGGTLSGGVASTVVEVTTAEVRVLRAGAITDAALRAALAEAA